MSQVASVACLTQKRESISSLFLHVTGTVLPTGACGYHQLNVSKYCGLQPKVTNGFEGEKFGPVQLWYQFEGSGPVGGCI